MIWHGASEELHGVPKPESLSSKDNESALKLGFLASHSDFVRFVFFFNFPYIFYIYIN